MVRESSHMTPYAGSSPRLNVSREEIVVLILATALAAGSCRSPRATAPAPTASSSTVPRERTTGELDVVATFDQIEPGGVAVTRTGRIFVSVPRYDPDIPFTLVEIVDGKPKPFPNPELNERNESTPEQHLLSTESVVIGSESDLWVLDSGRPDFEPTVQGGAKLLRIDLETNQIERQYVFSDDVARPSSLLADVRIDLRRGESGMAFITDASPAGSNGLVVLDLASGETWRKLDLHPSTRANPEFTGIVEGERFMFDPEGRPASPLSLGANGLAIAADGERLFFRPLAGRELYSVRLDALADRSVTPPEVENTLRRYGDQGFASDGLAADDKGRIYMTNYEDGAVLRRHPNGRTETVVFDPRLLWPDSLEVTEGHLYILTNQTHREGVFNDGTNRVERPLVLYRTPIDAGPVRLK